ncbi:MAG TPA: hypothetical protein PLD54_02710 [Candidatus Levybacteria bacterium]|nr:hypothetical protein [Candidatus Levybacteria bacterium]
MKKTINILLSDNIIKMSAGISFTVLLVCTILIAVFYTKLPPYIPFFNSLPWGTQRLFSSIGVIFLPIIFLVIILLNNALSAYLYSQHALMARMVSFNGLLFVILGFLAYVQIVLLVL